MYLPCRGIQTWTWRLQKLDCGAAIGLGEEQAPEDESLALCHLLGSVGDSLLAVFISPDNFPSLAKAWKN